jgi:serine/threonine protein kinase
MPSDAMTLWFKSQKPAHIEGMKLTLRPHERVRGIPLSSQQGQAEVFFAKAQNGSPYILKRFHQNKQPETVYLTAVRSLLPSDRAFRCGKERLVLSKKSLKNAPDCYVTPQLAAYLENSLLMPQIEGMDWASFICQIRNGKKLLSRIERQTLCSRLAHVVKRMEDHSISHRDLSSGNVFIDPRTLDISLIDLDSLYHPSLKMPRMTTIGSEGYTAPFASPQNPAATFVPCAARFALAILSVEFLILDADSPCCHEGGLFEQNDLYKRQGKTLTYAVSRLKADHPDVLRRFTAALNSRCYRDCPAPQDWHFNGAASLRASCPNAPSLPQVSWNLRHKKIRVVTLPVNPWENLKGELKHGALTQSDSQRRSPGHQSMRPLGLDGTAQVYLQSVARPLAKSMGQGIRTLLKNSLGLFLLAVFAFWKKII